MHHRLPPLREIPRTRIAAAGALCVLVLIALGAASRAGSVSTRDSVPFNPRTSDDRIVVGVIASSEGPSAHGDDEVIRGLRVWATRLAGGAISYTPKVVVPIHGRFGGRLTAPVRLDVARTPGGPEQAAAAARRPIRQGADVLVGPTAPASLAAVSEVAARRRVLLLSINRPPAPVPTPRTSTWLSIPSAGQLDGTLAVVGARANAVGAPRRLAIVSA